jgi:AraC-like DNA-binding protein/ligand-binding sensor protein
LRIKAGFQKFSKLIPAKVRESTVNMGTRKQRAFKMTKDTQEILYTPRQTDPLLLKAQLMLSAYSKSTGAQIGITDYNHVSIPEVYDEITLEKNLCLYCIKQRRTMAAAKNQDHICNPCREIHISGMKKALVSGGSYTYKCELGFVFWTSPVYSGKRFVGALIGGGFLDNDREETVEKLLLYGGGESKEELLMRLSVYPRADPQHIKALAGLILICAEYLSQNSGNYHETLKRRGLQQTELMGELEKLKQQYPPDGPAPEYSLDKENEFLGAIRQGDAENARRLLNELLAPLLYSHSDEFKLIQYRVLELAVLLSRLENSSLGLSTSFSSVVQQSLKSLEEVDNTEELVDTLHLLTQHLAEQAFSFQGAPHFLALKRAEKFIQMNFSRKLSLNEIAAASGLSAPYFSTIFKKEMGENLSTYLNRLRVEKARRLLVETDLPLSKISLSCGFEDQSWFSKIFKSYSGINPAKYRQKKKISSPELPESRLSDDYHAIVKRSEP